MSFNIEKYRNKNETEKLWRLRRQFIEKYFNKFNEDQLLCLAQCYANVETMGCRYSHELMIQLRELTKDFKPSATADTEDQTNVIKKQQSTNELSSYSNNNNNNHQPTTMKTNQSNNSSTLNNNNLIKNSTNLNNNTNLINNNKLVNSSFSNNQSINNSRQSAAIGTNLSKNETTNKMKQMPNQLNKLQQSPQQQQQQQQQPKPQIQILTKNSVNKLNNINVSVPSSSTSLSQQFQTINQLQQQQTQFSLTTQTSTRTSTTQNQILSTSPKKNKNISDFLTKMSPNQNQNNNNNNNNSKINWSSNTIVSNSNVSIGKNKSSEFRPVNTNYINTNHQMNTSSSTNKLNTSSSATFEQSSSSSSLSTYRSNSYIGTITPSVPSSTTEQSPAPSLVPIPFGLSASTSTSTNNINNNNNTTSTTYEASTGNMLFDTNNDLLNNSNGKDLNDSFNSSQSKSRTPIINSRNALLNSLHASKNQTNCTTLLKEAQQQLNDLESLSLSAASSTGASCSNQERIKENPLSFLIGLNKENSFNFNLNQSDLLINGTNINNNSQSHNNLIESNFQDSQFQKLSKISKLRDLLRDDTEIVNYITSQQKEKEFDMVAYFKNICEKNNIKLDYVQYVMPDNKEFYGEIYLEQFRLVNEQHRKRKKCCYFAHRKALQLLYGQSELAVRIAPIKKRDENIKLDDNDGNSSGEIQFDYELYLVDSDQAIINVTSANPPKTLNQDNFDSSILYQQISNDLGVNNNSLANHHFYQHLHHQSQPQLQLQQQQQHQFNEQESILHLDSMLKSLILPNKAQQQQQQNEFLLNSLETPSNQMIINNIINIKNDHIENNDEDNEDEDYDDTSRIENADKKIRIKEELPNFILFLPPTIGVFDPNDPNLFHERNSISILNNSCVRNNVKLEFELKLKSENNQSTKTVISGDRIQSESDGEEDSGETQKRKYKCKCLINRVKIVSSHSKNKQDAKRQAALKALNLLIKLYPIVKETNYQENAVNDLLLSQQYQQQQIFQDTQPLQSITQLPSIVSSSSNSTSRYLKITKEDLFSGLVPPTLFEAASAVAAATGATASSSTPTFAYNTNATTSTTINSNFGSKLLTKMGWKGEGYGLGKYEQGITKPIELDFNNCRLGFGCRIGDDYDDGDDDDTTTTSNNNNTKCKNQFELPVQDKVNVNNLAANFANKLNANLKEHSREKGLDLVNANTKQFNIIKTNKYKTKRDFIINIGDLLRKYTSSETEEDLVFDKSLGSDERKIIHREAHRLGLKTTSHGSGNERFLVVKKKRTSTELIDSLFKNGGQVGNFKLVSATGYSNQN